MIENYKRSRTESEITNENIDRMSRSESVIS